MLMPVLSAALLFSRRAVGRHAGLAGATGSGLSLALIVWLLLARALDSLFFVQPLNRVARRKLQEIAEYRCDDCAAEGCGCCCHVQGQVDVGYYDVHVGAYYHAKRAGRRISAGGWALSAWLLNQEIAAANG